MNKKPSVYKGKPNDTRRTVAEKFDLSIETLARLNPHVKDWRNLAGVKLNVKP